MSEPERYDVLVLGSGTGGKLIAWTMAREGKRIASIEREYVGGACPNVACLPSKNIIHTAKVASLFGRHQEFGIETGPIAVNMIGVYARKRKMVEDLIKVHLEQYQASGAELIWENTQFIGQCTLQVALRDGGERTVTAERVFVNVGNTRNHTRDTWACGCETDDARRGARPGAGPRTPDRSGWRYVGLEFAQAMRRFGSRVTLIARGPQLAPKEDPDVAQAILELFRDEGIDVALRTQVLNVSGVSGERVQSGGARRRRHANGRRDRHTRCGWAMPNTQGIGLEKAGIEVTEVGHIEVNDRLETTAPNVWAVGECAGSPYFTHVSEDDFRIVHANLNGPEPQHARPTDSLLSLYRPAARSGWHQRVTGSGKQHRLSSGVAPYGVRPEDTDSL